MIIHAYKQIVSQWASFDDEKGNLWRALTDLSLHWNKYSALNIYPLTDQNKGTIEYRQMHGTDDIPFINDWVNMLLMLKLYSIKKTPKELSTIILTLNNNSRYEQFVRDIFGVDYFYKYFGNMDLQKLIEVPVEDLKSMIIAESNNAFSLGAEFSTLRNKEFQLGAK